MKSDCVLKKIKEAIYIVRLIFNLLKKNAS